MNHMTQDSPDAPWHENVDHLFECDCCKKILNRYEELDPIEIDGRLFCDACAANAMYLRLEGFVKEASGRTKKLVADYNRKMWDKVIPWRGVKHI